MSDGDVCDNSRVGPQQPSTTCWSDRLCQLSLSFGTVPSSQNAKIKERNQIISADEQAGDEQCDRRLHVETRSSLDVNVITRHQTTNHSYLLHVSICSSQRGSSFHRLNELRICTCNYNITMSCRVVMSTFIWWLKLSPTIYSFKFVFSLFSFHRQQGWIKNLEKGF